jgi:hypothetical protein
MAGPRIHYSFSYLRELNLHRSKEQLEREFAKLEEQTSEFREFVSKFNTDIRKLLAKYGGVKTVTMPDRLYVVTRDRGLSFPDPMTVLADENQKLMLVRYIYLLSLRLFDSPDQAMVLTRAVCTKLPFSFERELKSHEHELNIIVPLPYDLDEKPLKKWLK